jgi:GT2 family glycosyltransferase
VPPKSSRSQSPGHLVTAVLVSHDGMRWLGEALAALTAQGRPPQRVVAVDTGSSDGSAALLATSLGERAVVHLPRDTGLAAAVQAGLNAFDGQPEPESPRGPLTHWVWILHDDCAPEPNALRELLATAADSPSLAAVAPKALSWDRRRLHEIGLTVDSSGHIHTGLESREVDQGQHDDVGEVLAAGTAGLLIKREVWDRIGGLDDAWPLFGDDVDLGWRLNSAGERMRVAPRAVVRHVGALTAGERPADAVSGRPGTVARRHGMQVVLANTATALVPLLLARYVVECVLRALALLLVARRPGEALDEFTALTGVLTHPGVVRQARRRRRTRVASHSEVRSLLAGPGLRWRLFGDRLAAAFRGRGAVEERSRRRAPVETGPVADEAESMALGETGMLLRALRRPGVLLAAGLTVLGLVASRGVLSGPLHGGRLLAAPAGASDLWSTYLSGWHAVGLGSSRPAPPALAVLALLSSVFAGKAWLAVSVLMLGAVPLAGLSAYLAAGGLTRSPWLRAWAGVLWAALPALTGAIAGGRLDVVVTVILLPLLARAVAAVVGREEVRAHRAVATGLLLAVVTAFSPVVWPAALVVAICAVLFVSGARLARLGAAVLMVAVAAAALLPWTGSLVMHPRLLVSGLGLPETLATSRPLGAPDVVLAHPGGPAQPPLWVLGPLVLAALVGLVRARHQVAARCGFALFLVAATGSLLVSRVHDAEPGDPAVHYWTGSTAALAALGLIVAAVVAGERARPALRRYAFGWRQAGAGLIGLGLVAGTVVAAGSLLVGGVDDPLTGDSSELLPVFAAAEVGRATSPRLVVLDGPLGGGREPVRYAVVRDPDGWRLGDADVARPAPDAADRRFTATIREAAAGQSSAVPELAEFGVSMLVVRDSGASALSQLADLDGLDRVPTSDALVWRSQVPTGELVMLGPRMAKSVADGGALPADAQPHPLVAHRGQSSARIEPGRSGRLLVLAEPASAHWSATLGGRTLEATKAYGWAQAWRLPTSGGRLDVGRTGDHRTLWLGLQLAAIVAALMLSVPVTGRRDRSPGVQS